MVKTVYATSTPISATEKGAIGGSSATPEGEEPTTTITSTLTSTRVIVLEAAATDKATNAGKGSGQGETPKGGEALKGGDNRVVVPEESSCPTPVTVTVTRPPVTITVVSFKNFFIRHINANATCP